MLIKAKSPAGHDITAALQAWSAGDGRALEDLLPLVHKELHRQATRHLRHERAGHTLQTTALINEAFVKLVDQRKVRWQSRAHFFAICSRLMRRVLVDYARARQRAKRGGSESNLPLDEDIQIATKESAVDLIALDEALNRLTEMDEQQAHVVELRYFSGLTIEETAEVLHISAATVKRDWTMAKAWLHHQLS